jgi:hypothetical protein
MQIVETTYKASKTIMVQKYGEEEIQQLELEAADILSTHVNAV